MTKLSISKTRRAFFERALLLTGGVSLGATAPEARAAIDAVSAPMALSTPFYNVFDYGAVGNGVTDDTQHIQDAINAAAASGGGTVLLPAAQYRVGGSLTITSNGITISGVNTKASILKVPNTSSANTISFSGCSGCVVRSLAISSTGRTIGTAIKLNNCNSTVIEDVDMEYQFSGLMIDGGVVHRINRGYWIINSGGTGITVGGTQGEISEVHISRISLDANDVAQAAVGLSIKWAGGVFVDSCDFISCVVGLSIAPGPIVVNNQTLNQTVNFCFFSNTCWDSSGDRNIVIVGTQNSQVHGLSFSNCWSASSVYDNCVVTGYVNGCSFVGHKFLNSTQGNGLWVNGPNAKNVFVDACVASGIPVGNAYCFVGNATDFAVRNSFAGVVGAAGTAVFPPNLYGLRVTSGCNNYLYTGNVLRGNGTNLLDQGGPNKSVGTNLQV